jgi:hypothetical protein
MIVKGKGNCPHCGEHFGIKALFHLFLIDIDIMDVTTSREDIIKAIISIGFGT